MEHRKPLIAGNWKMYKNVPEAVESARTLVSRLGESARADVMIAPAFPALFPVAQVLQASPVHLGAQDLHWEKEGAFTGEVSAAMLVSAGCRFVIVGHSERRQYFGETDETVRRKLSAALDQGLIPVLCVGETDRQREADETFTVLDKQIRLGLEGFSPAELGALAIAYEPVWAIGTGKTATAGQAQEAHRFIRSVVASAIDSRLAGTLRILYGGSVKPANIAELMAMEDVDGALVGGASLNPESFSRIVLFE